MRSVLALCAFVFAGCCRGENRQPVAQGNILFTKCSWNDLSEDQQRIFMKVKDRPTVVDVDCFKVNRLNNNKDIIVDFKLKNSEVEIKGCTLVNGKLTLNKEGRDYLILIYGTNCSGLIYSGSKVYSVESLGGPSGRVAIYEIDQTKFPKDDPSRPPIK